MLAKGVIRWPEPGNSFANGADRYVGHLLALCRTVTKGCFPGCTLMLVLLEAPWGSSSKGCTATADTAVDDRATASAEPAAGFARRYLVVASEPCEALEVETGLVMGLDELPSVALACKLGHPLLRNAVRQDLHG